MVHFIAPVLWGTTGHRETVEASFRNKGMAAQHPKFFGLKPSLPGVPLNFTHLYLPKLIEHKILTSTSTTAFLLLNL